MYLSPEELDAVIEYLSKGIAEVFPIPAEQAPSAFRVVREKGSLREMAGPYAPVIDRLTCPVPPPDLTEILRLPTC